MQKSGKPISVAPPEHAIQIESVAFDFDQFEKLKLNQDFQIEFYGTPFLASVDKLKTQSNGRTIFGHLDGIRESQFVLTTYGPSCCGNIFYARKRGHHSFAFWRGRSSLHPPSRQQKNTPAALNSNPWKLNPIGSREANSNSKTRVRPMPVQPKEAARPRTQFSTL